MAGVVKGVFEGLAVAGVITAIAGTAVYISTRPERPEEVIRKAREEHDVARELVDSGVKIRDKDGFCYLVVRTGSAESSTLAITSMPTEACPPVSPLPGEILR